MLFEDIWKKMRTLRICTESTYFGTSPLSNPGKIFEIFISIKYNPQRDKINGPHTIFPPAFKSNAEQNLDIIPTTSGTVNLNRQIFCHLNDPKRQSWWATTFIPDWELRMMSQTHLGANWLPILIWKGAHLTFFITFSRVLFEVP